MPIHERFYMNYASTHDNIHGRIQRGGGDPDPPENHKNIGFLSNTGPDPLKNHSY